MEKLFKTEKKNTTITFDVLQNIVPCRVNKGTTLNALHTFAKEFKRMTGKPLPQAYLDFLADQDGYADDYAMFFGSTTCIAVDDHRFPIIQGLIEMNMLHPVDSSVLLGSLCGQWLAYEHHHNTYVILNQKTFKVYERQYPDFETLLSSVSQIVFLFWQRNPQ